MPTEQKKESLSPCESCDALLWAIEQRDKEIRRLRDALHDAVARLGEAHTAMASSAQRLDAVIRVT